MFNDKVYKQHIDQFLLFTKEIQNYISKNTKRLNTFSSESISNGFLFKDLQVIILYNYNIYNLLVQKTPSCFLILRVLLKLCSELDLVIQDKSNIKKLIKTDINQDITISNYFGKEQCKIYPKLLNIVKNYFYDDLEQNDKYILKINQIKEDDKQTLDRIYKYLFKKNFINETKMCVEFCKNFNKDKELSDYAESTYSTLCRWSHFNLSACIDYFNFKNGKLYESEYRSFAEELDFCLIAILMGEKYVFIEFKKLVD